MTRHSIIHADRNAPLLPSPIDPAWIVAGAPVARNAILARSADGAACTVAWDCTAGTFDWRYEVDETVHIVEGAVTVGSLDTPPRRLEPGDVAFFPAGTTARWHVESYVRKVAFCRRTLPRVARTLIRMLQGARALLRKPPAGGSLMEARARRTAGAGGP